MSTGVHTAPLSAAGLAEAPIGVFDSGMGGLSVLRAIRAQLPNEALLYFADAAHAPYGERSAAFVDARTAAVCAWLAAQGAKAVVIACNTATAHAIDGLRARFAIPVIGVEPALKPAALRSASRVAGVLATAGTLRSDRFRQLLARYAGDCRFICQAGQGLVEAIEHGDIDSPSVRGLLARYLQPILDAGADTLVLGCTHYPFLDGTIRSLTRNRLTLIDTGAPVARQLLRRLSENSALRVAPASGATLSPRLCSSGDGTHLARMARSLLNLNSAITRVHIPFASPMEKRQTRVNSSAQGR